MAKAAARSSANTELYIGTLKASVGLFGTEAKPEKTAQFDTAGPNGGVLKYEQRAAETPVEEQTDGAPDVPVASSDPLGDPGSEAPPIEEDGRGTGVHEALAEAVGTVEGEYRQVLVEEGTGIVVEPDAVRRGVRLDDGKFIDCTPQLAAIDERTKLDRIEVVACIDSTQIRRERVTGTYYVGAQDEQAPPVLRLFYEALRARREVAVVKYTTRSRQQLGVIAASGRSKTLMLLSLVFAEDFREPPTKALSIQKAGVTQAQVERMMQLLGALHGTHEVFDDLRDDAIALREELKVRALAGEMDASVVEPLPVAEDEQDIEAALVESLDAVRAGKV